MGNGKADFEMDMVHKSGQTVLSMMVIGRKVKLMEKVLLHMLMEMPIREIGQTTRLMVREYIRTQMELLMKVTGKTICKKEKVLKDGLMGLCMKETT